MKSPALAIRLSIWLQWRAVWVGASHYYWRFGVEDEFNIREYVSFLLRWYRLILLAALLTGLTAFGVSLLQPPTYEAEAAVMLVKSGTQLNFDPKMTTVSDMNAGYSDQEARRKSLALLAKSSSVASAVIAKIGDQLSPTEQIPANLAGAINSAYTGDVLRSRRRHARQKRPRLSRTHGRKNI